VAIIPAQNPIVFDVETSVIPDIEDYRDDLMRVPGRYRDPEKIAKWIEEAQEKQARFAALDMDLARVVAVCWTTDGKRLRGGAAPDFEAEKVLIARFWSESTNLTKIGFNILDFDLPLLVRRSQYLGIDYPFLELSRYRHPGSTDLMQVLTFDGKINARTLNFYCKRFGITAPPDDMTGADIPALVSLGEWDKVKRHCGVDVIKEWRLADRIGVIDLPEAPEPGAPF